jgi:hypothetical protein
MIESLNGLVEVIETLYPDIASRPKPFKILAVVPRLQAGEEPKEIAKEIRTTPRKLNDVLVADDPVQAVLKSTLKAGREDKSLEKAKGALGSMLVGTLAERAFEKMYREEVGTDELRLEDEREGRTDTDYRVLNGHSRPVFRLNIKFHGGTFRQARELAGIEPDDCFALATYKIKQALDKQDREHLPYLFVVVGVKGLRNIDAGAIFPEDFIHLRSLLYRADMPGKRDVEDRMVEYVVDNDQPQEVRSAVREFYKLIEGAGWRVISARKADKLLREKLFDRVFAVRIRAFTSAYRNAEVDMHFSICQDLTPLMEFLDVLRDHGLQGMTSRLERGTL